MSLGKIILRSTTRISLNDRFTVLRSENTSQNNQYDSVSENQQVVQASRKNQRLAAQMERRPAVMAALKTKKNISNRLNGHQPMSVKQRLALPGRLRMPDSAGGPSRGGIRIRMPDSAGGPSRGVIRGRGVISGRGIRRGFSNRIRGGVGVRGKFEGRIGTVNRGFDTPFRGGRGGRFIGLRGAPRGRGGQRGRGRGFLNGRGSFKVFKRET